MGIRGEVFSAKAPSESGTRTYFFNVKENRKGDLFLNVVESKKNEEETFERRSIIVFEEDLEVFLKGFEGAVRFMQNQTGKGKKR